MVNTKQNENINMFSPWTLCYIILISSLLSFSWATCPPQDAILPCRCLARGIEIQVWCSHSTFPKLIEGLQAVAQHVDKPIDELILENNQIPSLPGKSFFPLKIRRLMLRFNGLERVSAEWLSGIEESLMELFVVEPDLRSLPEDSLVRLNALEALTIQSNLMKRLPRISALPRLRYVHIESLSLIELSPRHFKSLPTLEKLHIVGSPRLTRLEGGLLQDLPNLAILNISFCGITWIHPRAITHLPSLIELWLVGNKIVDAAMVGRSIRDLPALQILRIDFNNIDRIGEAAFVDLPSLRKLFISNNRVTELNHGAFHRVPKLKMIDLNYNLVRKVHPESFLQHSDSGLEELWLVENDIGHVAELRSLLDALPRLIFLDLSHNKLEAIPFGALRGHPTLERLHLDHNRIHLVDTEAFMAMPALRELRMKNNSLSDIIEGPLWNLPALKGLDLSNNYFRRIEPQLLHNLPSLRKIDLSGNNIILIDPTCFLATPALEHVNMSGNALATVHPATFRHLLELFELDVSDNRLVEFVPGLPRGLEYLHMSRNQITSLPLPPTPDLDLPSLKMLSLGGNGIQKIPFGTLRTMPQLKKLYLGHNLLQQIDEESLQGLHNLEILDLHKNRLMQIHPNSLKNMVVLRELRLSENMLGHIDLELFQQLSKLKRLDLSKNQLNEVPDNMFESTRDLQLMDVSNNMIQNLPASLFGMKHLRILDVANNRLRTIQPEILSSLPSLTHLYLSRNTLQSLKRGAFDNLPVLEVLNLDNNELESIESQAIHTLPALKSLKINQNKLETIPNEVFANLQSLQIVELQENQLRTIAPEAFSGVPHLLMLNLSNNYVPSLEEAGLQSMKALEMLDLSSNRLSGITSTNLEKMEWLVELRMDNNQICAVHGSPFNGMPRLRVLSLRNNRMTSFPEHAVQRLRENLAVLDINGNPLICSCSLLWFKVWLQESSAVGPRCSDGTLLRDMTISRQQCEKEGQQREPVASGCEAELLSVPGMYGTSQVFSKQWMDMKRNNSMHSNKLAPSPEESDYFYDEYVDYPFNVSFINASLQNGSQPVKPEMSNVSPHLVPGDTPTLYAGSANSSVNKNIPKGVPGSPSSSGFTFFGLPLPNLNLNSLFRGNGRMSDKPHPNIAERKSAIINQVPHMHPYPRPYLNPQPPHNRHGHGHLTGFPPTLPDIQTGGFVPLLPGERGFKPIANPMVKTENVTVDSVPQSTAIPISTSDPPFAATDWSTRNNLIVTSSTTEFPNLLVQPPRPPPVVENVEESNITSVVVINPTSTTTNSKLDDFFDDFIDINISTTQLPLVTSPIAVASSTITIRSSTTEIPIISTSRELPSSTTSSGEDLLFEDVIREPTLPTADVSSVGRLEDVTTSPTYQPITEDELREPPTALSALLVPGGEQPQYRPQGRPIITRVPSPHIAQGDLEVSEQGGPLPLPQNAGEFETVPEYSTPKPNKQDMKWYFMNYNKTDIEPYIGPGGHSENSGQMTAVHHCFIIIGIIIHLF